MKYLLIISLFLFVHKETPEQKAKQMCDCFKQALKSTNKDDKKKCLELQEKIVKELGEGTEAHKEFKKKTNECMAELMAANAPKATETTFEGKVKHTCDCMKSAGGDRKKRMDCIQLQDIYSKSFLPDTASKRQFLLKTNECM